MNNFQALPQRDDADKMEKHMFRVYDANDDGYVDFVEFMVRIQFWERESIFSNNQMIFYIMSDGSPEDVLAKIFRVFDVNRSNQSDLELSSYRLESSNSDTF